MILASGADEIITMELHSAQSKGFFDVPCKNLTTEQLIADWIQTNFKQLKNLILVSPDAGGSKRVGNIAEMLDVHFVVFDKERKKANEVSKMVLHGDISEETFARVTSNNVHSLKSNVMGKDVVIIDDMADS